MITTANSPRSKKKSLVVIGSLLVAFATALTGCTSAVNSPQATSATPTKGGALVVATASKIVPTVPLGGTQNGNLNWISNVFETLTKIDPKTNDVKGVLATDWKFAANGMSMTINLQKGVTFQNGHPMTADGVKWTFLKAMDPLSGSQVGFIAKGFSSIDVTSPTSLSITFSTKTSPATIFDFLEQTYILDPTTYAGFAGGTQVIGTGPYKWGAFTPGVSLKLEKYDGYWNKSKETSYLDSIEFDTITDPTALLSAVRSGSAQVAYGLDTSNLSIFSNTKQYTVMDSAGSIFPLGFDVTKAPFSDVRVRQAITYAIDANRINKQVFANTGTVTDLYWGPSSPGYTKELAHYYSYDPTKAKQLLSEAGATGAEVPITYLAGIPVAVSEYEIIANNLTAVGLKPVAVPLDNATFNTRQIQGKLGSVFLMDHGQVGYGNTTMLTSIPSLRKGNPSQFYTDEYDQLRNALMTASTTAQSATALQKLSTYMLQQAFAVPFLQAPNEVVVSKAVQGVQISKRGMLLFTNAYMPSK